jgi:MFS family permease
MLSYIIPARWEMAILLFSGALIVYTQRVAISVASAQMMTELGWTLSEKGLVLSAFYWGYAFGQIFAPMLVQAIGPKFVFALSIFLPSVTTLFIPAAARDSFGLVLFLLCMLGLFQSVTFPAIYQFIPLWIPLEEKTIMVPFIYTGCPMGNIVGYSVCSRLLTTSVFVNGRPIGGWDGCFYVFGLLGLAWLPCWMLLGFESPSKHPHISKEELEIINFGKHFPTSESLENMSKKYFPSDLESDNGIQLIPRSPDSHTSDDISGTATVGATLHSSYLGTIEEDESDSGREPIQQDTNIRVNIETPPPSPATSPEKSPAKSMVGQNVGELSTPRKSSIPHGRNRLYSETSSNATPTREGRSGSFPASPLAYHMSVKYRRYEDDHLEHEYSEPIALEDLAMNMMASASSRLMRVDGMSSLRPGRPRTLTIVAQVKHRQFMASETPWLNFVTHPVALTLLLNSWCSNWISYTLMSEMPAFLSDALGFDLSKAGMLCIFPYVALALCSLSCGGIFEYLQNEHGVSTDTVRKSGNFIAFVVSSVFLVICGFMNDKYIAYIFMIITQGLTGAIQVGLSCAYSDIAPNYSSALNTLGNLIGSVAGIAGPLVVADVLQAQPGIWGWRIIFFVTLAQAIFGIIFWFVFQTSKPVPELNCPRSDKLGWYKDSLQ